MYSQVLGLPAESIGMDNSLFRLGGDSLTAMRSASLFCRDGFEISLEEIFAFPTISSLTIKIRRRRPFTRVVIVLYIWGGYFS